MRSVVLFLTLASLLAASPARALPILGTETPQGTRWIETGAYVPPSPKTVDGAIADWSGAATGFAGEWNWSHGELVYTDHLFDAYGADDGGDAQRLEATSALTTTVPETYRLGAILENDPAGQVGAPAPEQLTYATNYGDLPLQDRADLTEVRLSGDDSHLWLLARTTTMTSANDVGILVLLSDGSGKPPRDVGFGSGLTSGLADRAVLLVGNRGWVRDLATGAVAPLPAGSVATRPDGWDNAVEARLDRASLGIDGTPSFAVAAGRPTADGDALAGVANVAFRRSEPVREFFDRAQALALHAGSIDGFFTYATFDQTSQGRTEVWSPRAGYHERVFRSSEAISSESGTEGILQHYGVYLPPSYPATGSYPFHPMQLWLHWRGGTAHSAGHTIPGMFRDLGTDHETIVVAPRGRGSSTWYAGRGQVDVEEVWADAHRTFRIDAARRYVSGHSMGGWGSFLMTVVHPDWFAASLPASPPVTQGAWTGLDFEGCDDLDFEVYSPCYSGANGGDPRAQHTRRLLENLRHVPTAIYHGLADELVPYSGVARQAERLIGLGYRHRFYTFPTQEHFGPPVWDEWDDAGAWMHTFRIPTTPGRVTFKRDMPFERAIERVNSGGATLDFSFDGAYWLDGLEPVDALNGVASFDGRSLAVAETDPLVAPDAGGPASIGQTGPFLMVGLQWLGNPLAKLPLASNGFTASVTGARAATLDTTRMRLDVRRPLTGTVTTGAPLTLTLAGPWARAPKALVNGLPRPVTLSGGAAAISLGAGTSTLALTP